MLPVQPGCLDGGDEELRPIGVLARVGHAQPACPLVLQLEVLIGELVAIDALASRAIPAGEISTWKGKKGGGEVNQVSRSWTLATHTCTQTNLES